MIAIIFIVAFAIALIIAAVKLSIYAVIAAATIALLYYVYDIIRDPES